MSNVEVSAIPKAQKDELVVSYAALLLHDDKQEINVENLEKVIKESGNSVESYWPGLFAQALGQADVGDLIKNMGAGAPAPAAAAGGADDAPKEEAPKEEKKEE